jgi:hypothetical protein
MLRSSRVPVLSLVPLVAATAVYAQPTPPTAGGGTRPAARPIGAVVSSKEGVVSSATTVRSLPNGQMLVNDLAGRQVVLLDSTFAPVKVVADTTPATGNAYSGRFAGLIPFRGDSTLFVDPQSLAMLVVDPSGNLGRTMSIPNAQEAPFIAGAGSPTGYDPRGKLVYRGVNLPRMGGPGMAPPQPGQPFAMPKLPDSAVVQRVTLATRAVDTVAFFQIPRPSMEMTQTEGRVVMRSRINPIPLVDDWTMLPNGDVAVVRGRDYHVDVYRTDGTTLQGPKLPYNWRRLTDDDKVTFLDSVKAARARMPAPTAAAGPAVAMTMGGNGGPPPAAMPPMGGGGGMQIVMMGGPAGGGGAGAAMGDGPRSAPPQMQMGPPQMSFVDPSELPDYLPPFAANSTRADPQGRLWIRLSLPTPAGTGPLYDVIDGATGTLVDHVQMPVGRTLAGFLADGSVVMQSRTDAGAVRLERARLR